MDWSKSFKVGNKVKFYNEKKTYTIQACNNRYAICNYPINMIRHFGLWGTRKDGKRYVNERTVIYTIIDLVKNVRGPENLIFGLGAETRSQCEEMLTRLTQPFEKAITEVSYRHRLPLDIEWIKPATVWEK